MKKIFLLLTLLFTFPSAVHAEHKAHVVASFSIIGDLVRQVAGDNVEIKTLVGPDGNVHEYEPTPSDARVLSGADIVFINGLGLEGWIERLIRSSGFKGNSVVLTKGIPLEHVNGHEDPHAWQNPQDTIIYINNIRDALIAADPVHAQQYRDNATHYIARLKELDEWVGMEISHISPERRKIICQHDSFHYFSTRYGIEIIAPLGISTESQPSAADLARVIDQIRRQKITAVFLENMSDPHLMYQLEHDAHARRGGTLYSDALSSPDGPAPDYITMFRHNVSEMVAAMQADTKQ